MELHVVMTQIQSIRLLSELPISEVVIFLSMDNPFEIWQNIANG